MAMGYVFSKVSDLDIRLPAGSSHVLLKASDAPLGPFYNEHRDRRALFSSNGGPSKNVICLDRNSEAVFDDGWYEATMLPPIARWMGKQGRISFRMDRPEVISLDLMTSMTNLRDHPLGLELLLNGSRLCEFTLYKHGWLNVSVRVPEELSAKAIGEFELELRANRVAQNPQDDREVSVAVCNIEVWEQRSEVGDQKSEVGDRALEILDVRPPTSDL